MRLEQFEDRWAFEVEGLLGLCDEASPVFGWPLAILTILVCGAITVAYLTLKLLIPRKYQ